MDYRISTTLVSSNQAAERQEQQQNVVFVREVVANYRGQRRATVKIKGPQCAADFIRKVLPDNSREHFVALYLDGSHTVVAYFVAFTGTANSCQTHPREIFQCAVLAGAVSMVVGHNHPSGGLQPSIEDRKVTQKLQDAGRLLGIKVLDHVIVADTAYHSFNEESGGW